MEPLSASTEPPFPFPGSGQISKATSGDMLYIDAYDEDDAVLAPFSFQSASSSVETETHPASLTVGGRHLCGVHPKCCASSTANSEQDSSS